MIGSGIIAVTSGKGGVGKSTAAAGLAAALARTSRRVLLLDADEGLRCLDLMLGVSDAVYDLGDLLEGRCSVQEAARPVENCPNLRLIAAPARVGALRDGRRLADLCERLCADCDVLLIDSAAGVGAGMEAAASAAREILNVVTPDSVCIRDAQRVRALLPEGAARPRMIVNRYDDRRVRRGAAPTLDGMIDQTGMQLAAVIPEDAEVRRCAAAGLPLREGRAARAFDRLARRLGGENVPLPPLRKL